jgi:hypothetical protein
MIHIPQRDPSGVELKNFEPVRRWRPYSCAISQIDIGAVREGGLQELAIEGKVEVPVLVDIAHRHTPEFPWDSIRVRGALGPAPGPILEEDDDPVLEHGHDVQLPISINIHHG